MKSFASMLAVVCGLISTCSYGESFVPSMAPQQETALNQAFSRASEPSIAQAISEAEPTIKDVLSRMACLQKIEPDRALGRHLAPDSEPRFFVVPIPTMKYHSNGQCLSITRVDGWQMPARNVLQFRAVYESQASGESKSLIYKMIKQPDGAWLMRSGS